MGLLPWQAERLTIAELEVYARAEQLRWNRVAAVIAWFVVGFPSFVAMGVGYAISCAFSKSAKPMQRMQYLKVLRSVPGYREIGKERKEE